MGEVVQFRKRPGSDCWVRWWSKRVCAHGTAGCEREHDLKRKFSVVDPKADGAKVFEITDPDPVEMPNYDEDYVVP